MQKTVSSNPLEKTTSVCCAQNHLFSRNGISRLPDEITVSVLSFLGIREAGRTCVLSKRWEQLWSYHRVLNFDASQTIFDLESNPNPKLLKVERCRYINWVNKVTESHCGSTIDEFRVSFCLNRSSSCVIDRWIEFAIAKRVQRLELDLEPSYYIDRGRAYTFPNPIYIHIKSPAGLSSIRSLRSLCFKRVNISGEILEYFLSNCPLLESLQVDQSRHLVNLKVFGSSLRLKVLEITFCPKLMDVEVSATSLVSFKYVGLGQAINMQIKDAFQLAHLSCSDFVVPIERVFFQFSSYFSQLETLLLTINFRHFPKANAAFEQLPEFSKLKHLTLQLVADNFSKLLVWTTLINASPLLHKFELQIDYLGPREKQYERKMLEGGNCPHQSLKEVELAGFCGRVIDLEFAHYLIKNAVTVEKIIINRHCTIRASRPRPWLFEETKEKQYAKKCAMELQKSLPSRIKMEII
ncbi:putative F-box/LRR-repeat protein At4g15060 [Cornus florida]|uniref:putative F-box/LRR-repeat protein At4g15060 n=1 Tax=Cornus florida TaxID=4283 RepID=UPI0028A0DAD7|nr:putative F-box/LRR-repeat protein At4g15060 [Cornus florida]